ncbi:hypothetical protein EHS25_009644 [Saitozyma podzolica]|uniref:Beta-glucosidase 1B n=1 Tax=Saitozyma podzolica TaxID=1890683 RepID=A0A427YJS5_9TREE|nr:hypothetical protein EHS25_009644 [Saitozyma podzolica]
MTTKGLRPDFLYGFATAAAQIEGGGADKEKASGKGPSIWDAFCDVPGNINDGTHVNKTCDHLGRYKEDVALMAKLGVNSYRFSISWPRVVPLGGRDDPINEQGLQFYSDLVDELLKHNIIPFVTLFHWDLPQGLHERYGGWLNKDEVVADYVRYARVCFERLGDRVKHWLTFNEPWCIAGHGYGYGQFAPGHKSNTEPWIVGHNVIVAHAHASKLYRDEFKAKQGGIIGITLNGDWTVPYDDSAESKKAAQDKMDVAVGWFADPIYLGHYPDSMRKMLGDRLPRFTNEELALLKDSSEFYGMNFYTTHIIRAGADDELNGNTYSDFKKGDGSWIGLESDMGWHRSVPWGCRKMLNYLWDKYKTPIYMTENGMPVKGESDMPKDKAIRTRSPIFFEAVH